VYIYIYLSLYIYILLLLLSPEDPSYCQSMPPRENNAVADDTPCITLGSAFRKPRSPEVLCLSPEHGPAPFAPLRR
jgi:hypothetical protein